jgi:hypothetical protein
VDASYATDNTHVIRVSGGSIGFGPSSDLRLAVLQADEGLLVIALNAQAGHMGEAEELTESVRDSITISQLAATELVHGANSHPTGPTTKKGPKRGADSQLTGIGTKKTPSDGRIRVLLRRKSRHTGIAGNQPPGFAA